MERSKLRSASLPVDVQQELLLSDKNENDPTVLKPSGRFFDRHGPCSAGLFLRHWIGLRLEAWQLDRLDSRALEARRGLSVLVELVAGPEHTSSEHAQPDVVVHGLVVVSERSAKDAGFAEVVGPRDRVNRLCVLPVGEGEWNGVRPDLFNDVELTGRRSPVEREVRHDRVRCVHVLDRHSAVLFVTTTGDSDQLTPCVRSCWSVAVAVQGTVNEDRRNALVMSLCDGLHEIVVLDAAKAFVVHDDVVLARPAWLSVDGNFVIPPGATFVDNVECNAEPLPKTFTDYLLLIVVVVAAATSDQQTLQFGLVFCISSKRDAQTERETKCKSFHHEAPEAAMSCPFPGNLSAGAVAASCQPVFSSPTRRWHVASRTWQTVSFVCHSLRVAAAERGRLFRSVCHSLRVVAVERGRLSLRNRCKAPPQFATENRSG